MNTKDIENSTDANGGVDEFVIQSDTKAAADPFEDLQSLRLSQDFSALATVKPVITTVGVRKPNRQEFVRVRPGSEWRFETGTFTDSESREVYLVAPPLWSELPGEVKPTCLVMCISRNSPVPFLWPIPLPGPDGRPNRWHESAFEAAKHAEQNWLRVVADMAAGCYVPHVAAGNLPEPDWPEDLDMSGLLRLGFRDRFISDVDHPALRRLRGEA
jgi:hypothetical protein